MSNYDDRLADYVEVADRIREFRTKHPEGSLQQVDLQFREFGGTSWVIYTAAAYRTPDDQRPGHGTAWEQVPGRTPYTKGSELQNCETSAWGRAIVAALAADTQKIASADEVRNRRSEQRQSPQNANTGGSGAPWRQPTDTNPWEQAGGTETGEMLSEKQSKMIHRLANKLELDHDDQLRGYSHVVGRNVSSSTELTKQEASQVIEAMMKRAGETDE